MHRVILCCCLSVALPVCLSCHQGQFGFLLPDDQIIPNAEEMVPAMYEYGQAVLEAFRGAEARRADLERSIRTHKVG